MSRIAQDVLAAVFLSLDPEHRELVRTLTRNVSRLPLTPEEREDYVAGFILHAADAQSKALGTEVRRSVPPEEIRDTAPPEPITMPAAEIVRVLVHSTPPPAGWPLRKAAGEN